MRMFNRKEFKRKTYKNRPKDESKVPTTGNTDSAMKEHWYKPLILNAIH